VPTNSTQFQIVPIPLNRDMIKTVPTNLIAVVGSDSICALEID